MKRDESIYLAKPTSGKGRGVLVLHAWWGLNPFCKKVCDRLAQAGFVALAPDLYHGATASSIAGAKKLRSTLKGAVVKQEITQAAETLRGMTRAPIGIVGFSLGGYWALWLAEQQTIPVKATAIFYATRGGDYAGLSAFQFHFAARDDYVAVSGIKKLEKTLEAAGKEFEMFTYPGTTHWFFENDRADAYNAQAAALAWKRTMVFLKKYL